MGRSPSFYVSWKQIQRAASLTNRILLVLSLFIIAACAFPSSGVDTNYAAGVVLSRQNSSIFIEKQELVAGSSTKVTVFLRDKNFRPYISPNLQVDLRWTGVTNAGELSKLTDQGDGSYSASFLGRRVGDLAFRAEVRDGGNAAALSGKLTDPLLTVEPVAVRILPGAASRWTSTVTVSADEVISGSSITATAVFTAQDDYGNAVTLGGRAVTFSNSGRDSGGESTGVWGPVRDDGDGTYTAAFTGSRIGTPTTVSASMVSLAVTPDTPLPTVTVLGRRPESIAVFSGNSQTGVVGTTLGSWTAVVKDAEGNPVPDISVSWSVTSGGGSLSTATSVTDALGHASSTFTLGTTAGTNTATAQVTNSALVATFTASGTPGSVTSLAFDPPVSSSNTAGAAFGTQPTVKLYDLYSNLVITSSSPVVLSLSSGSGTLSGTTTQNASGGVATFTGLSVNLVGSKKITATIGTVTRASDLFTVSPGSPASITIHAGNNQANAYVGFQIGAALQVLVKDAYGNVVPNFQVNWAVDQTQVIGQLNGAPTSITDSNGLALNSYTMGSSTGENRIIASVTSDLGTFSALFVETGIALPSPTLSYSGSAGITGFVGTPMRITPTLLLPAGRISNCQVTSGSLPSGLSLDPFSCVISGTPTRDQTMQTVGVIASNSSGSGSALVSITVTCSANSIEFNYTGADQTFTPTCSQVSARMWGAGGGSPSTALRGTSVGGAGGFVQGTMSLDLTKPYKIIVGQGPGFGTSSPLPSPYGGGGGGSMAGGGRTAIQDASGDILTAGGGGGGGGGGAATLSGGGGGGLNGGDSSRITNIYTPASGGSQVAGGQGGGSGYATAGIGAKYLGGTGASSAGGGGGGFFGGGGSNANQGGGGGSSYYGGTVGVAVTNGVSIAATRSGGISTPGGSSDLHYKSGVGTTATNTKSGDGYAILYWGAFARSVSVNGTTLTIIGFNLTADTAVTFSGGASCTGISLFDSGDRMTCTIPNGLVNQDVTITVPGYAGKVFSNVL